jgi:hypothetical protein
MSVKACWALLTTLWILTTPAVSHGRSPAATAARHMAGRGASGKPTSSAVKERKGKSGTGKRRPTPQSQKHPGIGGKAHDHALKKPPVTREKGIKAAAVKKQATKKSAAAIPTRSSKPRAPGHPKREKGHLFPHGDAVDRGKPFPD